MLTRWRNCNATREWSSNKSKNQARQVSSHRLPLPSKTPSSFYFIFPTFVPVSQELSSPWWSLTVHLLTQLFAFLNGQNSYSIPSIRHRICYNKKWLWEVSINKVEPCKFCDICSQKTEFLRSYSRLINSSWEETLLGKGLGEKALQWGQSSTWANPAGRT